MARYKCFVCDKEVGNEYLKKRIRCPYCGNKMLFKPRDKITKLKAI